MKKIWLSSLSLAALAACAVPEETCEGYGFEPGTTAYAQCLMQVKAENSDSWQRVAASLDGMTMSGNTGNVQTAPTNSTGRLVYLQNQWVNNGNRMCQYSDGSVSNIGVGVCPRNR